MKLRTRVATVVSAVVLLAGLGAGVQAQAVPKMPLKETRGCVYVIPVQVAVCIPKRN